MGGIRGVVPPPDPLRYRDMPPPLSWVNPYAPSELFPYFACSANRSEFLAASLCAFCFGVLVESAAVSYSMKARRGGMRVKNEKECKP